MLLASSAFSHFRLNHNGRKRKKGGQRCRSRSGRRGILEDGGMTICRRENICIELKKWHFMRRKWASAWNSQWHHSWAEWRRSGVRWSGPSWDGMTGLEFYERGSDTKALSHTCIGQVFLRCDNQISALSVTLMCPLSLEIWIVHQTHSGTESEYHPYLW